MLASGYACVLTVRGSLAATCRHQASDITLRYLLHYEDINALQVHSRMSQPVACPTLTASEEGVIAECGVSTECALSIRCMSSRWLICLEVSTGSRALSGRFHSCHVSLFEHCSADGAAEERHAADVGVLWPDRHSAHPQQPPARCRHLLVQVCLQKSLGQEVLLACL